MVDLSIVFCRFTRPGTPIALQVVFVSTLLSLKSWQQIFPAIHRCAYPWSREMAPVPELDGFGDEDPT